MGTLADWERLGGSAFGLWPKGQTYADGEWSWICDRARFGFSRKRGSKPETAEDPDSRLYVVSITWSILQTSSRILTPNPNGPLVSLCDEKAGVSEPLSEQSCGSWKHGRWGEDLPLPKVEAS